MSLLSLLHLSIKFLKLTCYQWLKRMNLNSTRSEMLTKNKKLNYLRLPKMRNLTLKIKKSQYRQILKLSHRKPKKSKKWSQKQTKMKIKPRLTSKQKRAKNKRSQ